MIESAAMWRELMRLGFGEDFCKVTILLGNFRRGFLNSGIGGRQKLGERGDRIEMENVDLIVGSDFGS